MEDRRKKFLLTQFETGIQEKVELYVNRIWA